VSTPKAMIEESPVRRRDIRWLVTDLDGTIVGRDLQLVQRSVQAVRAFRRSGREVFVATGRNEESALPYYTALGLDTPAILYNGARIVDLTTGKRLRDLTVDAQRLAGVREIMPRLATRLGVVGFCDRHAYVLRDGPKLASYAARDRIALLPADRLSGPPEETGFSKIMIIGAGPDDLGEPRKLLADVGVRDHLVQSESGYLEVLPDGADKGSALRWLAAYRGIDIAQIAAIGDNPNDAAMISVAGLGVAVSGAHADARAAADLVVGRCENGAVAELIASLGIG